MIAGIVSRNFLTLFELIGLIAIISISTQLPARTKKLTFAAIAVIFIELVCYEIELYTRDLESYTVVRPLLTAAVYSLYPVMLIILTRITTQSWLKKFIFVCLLIPEIISVPLFFTSQWTHIVCYYNETNNFLRGPLSYLPYCLFAFYLLIFVIFNAVYLRNALRSIRSMIYFIVFGPAAGVVLYLVLDITDDYSPLFVSALLLYFLFIYYQMARLDPLTELFNRQSYYSDSKLEASHITGIISIDINSLKTYNDISGNDAGDNVLRAVAKVIKDNCGSLAKAYRIGGDEIVVMYKNADKKYMKKYYEQIKKKMAATGYGCAFGYADIGDGKNVEEIFRAADGRMYADKTGFKEAEKTKLTETEE